MLGSFRARISLVWYILVWTFGDWRWHLNVLHSFPRGAAVTLSYLHSLVLPVGHLQSWDQIVVKCCTVIRAGTFDCWLVCLIYWLMHATPNLKVYIIMRGSIKVTQKVSLILPERHWCKSTGHKALYYASLGTCEYLLQFWLSVCTNAALCC